MSAAACRRHKFRGFRPFRCLRDSNGEVRKPEYGLKGRTTYVAGWRFPIPPLSVPQSTALHRLAMRKAKQQAGSQQSGIV